MRLPKLGSKDSERKFEKFIRAIRQCNSLSDARRFRSEVASQLRKESAVESQDSTYIRRLNTGKRILDQRVAFLSAGGSAARKSSAPNYADQPVAQVPALENATLRDVLRDATGLSYFMEYMDRMKLMRLVQFWIVVDGFRNPLEEDTDEPDSSLASSLWNTSDRMDLAQMNEAYLSKPELQVAGEYRETVSSFLKSGSNATPTQYHAARRAVLKSQTAVYEAMKDLHFLNFKKSDLFYKWLAANDAVAASKSQKPAALGLDRLDIQVEDTSARSSSRPRMRSTSPSVAHRLAPKPQDLQRSVASSSDLRSGLQRADLIAPTRRSMDDSMGRAPLFGDGVDSDSLARSTASIDLSYDQARKGENDEQIVDAMQAALNSIMEGGQEQNDTERSSLFADPSLTSPHEVDSVRGSLDTSRPGSPALRKDKGKPSISSLGLVGAPSRLGVFSEDDLFGEEEKFLEDEHDDGEKNENSMEDEIHEAAPGDLGLAEAISSLTAEIERLTNQDSIIGSLTNKAELTNNAAELRILRK